jgi:hypothetical protein
MTDVLSRMIHRASGSAPVVSSAVTPRRAQPQGAPGLLVETLRGDGVPAAAALPIVDSVRDASPAFPAPTAIEDGPRAVARGPDRPATPAVPDAGPQHSGTPTTGDAGTHRPAMPSTRDAGLERLATSTPLATLATPAPVDALRLSETPRVSPAGPSGALESTRPYAGASLPAASAAALDRAVSTRVEAAAAESTAVQPALPRTPPMSPPTSGPSAQPAGSRASVITATEVIVSALTPPAPEDRDRVAPRASAGPTTEAERVETGDVRALEVTQPRAPARAPQPLDGDASDPVASEDAPPAARPRSSRSTAGMPRVDLREALAAVGRALAQPPTQRPESSDEIHVTIGHVDVRAAAPAAAPPARRQPSITLAEYMRRSPGSQR